MCDAGGLVGERKMENQDGGGGEGHLEMANAEIGARVDLH